MSTKLLHSQILAVNSKKWKLVRRDITIKAPLLIGHSFTLRMALGSFV